MKENKMTSKELCELFHQNDYRTLFDALIQFEFSGQIMEQEVLERAYERYMDNPDYTGLIPYELREEIQEIDEDIKKEKYSELFEKYSQFRTREYSIDGNPVKMTWSEIALFDRERKLELAFASNEDETMDCIVTFNAETLSIVQQVKNSETNEKLYEETYGKYQSLPEVIEEFNQMTYDDLIELHIAFTDSTLEDLIQMNDNLKTMHKQ